MIKGPNERADGAEQPAGKAAKRGKEGKGREVKTHARKQCDPYLDSYGGKREL